MTVDARHGRPARWVVLHGAAATPPLPPDEQDTLDQAYAVAAALGSLGGDAVVLGVPLDLRGLPDALARAGPDAVFNLVESLGGHARLAHLAPALLESLGIPFTGCSASALRLTTDKLAAKERMAAAGVPTPAWVSPRGAGPAAGPLAADRWILKPVDEDASVGLDPGAVVRASDPAALGDALRRRAEAVSREVFAEEYVEGRELRVPLLAGPDGPVVLPPSELVFTGLPPERPRILDYRAKWDRASPEYKGTDWSLDFAPEDGPLLEQAARLALRCWDLFSLAGYARVDLRVDDRGRPWVLEVNGNPCLSPDSGFAEAARRRGLGFDEVVRRICASAAPRGGAAPAR